MVGVENCWDRTWGCSSPSFLLASHVRFIDLQLFQVFRLGHGGIELWDNICKLNGDTPLIRHPEFAQILMVLKSWSHDRPRGFCLIKKNGLHFEWTPCLDCFVQCASCRCKTRTKSTPAPKVRRLRFKIMQRMSFFLMIFDHSRF